MELKQEGKHNWRSHIFFGGMSVVMILVVIVRTLVFGDPTSGWPSLVCIMLLLSGIQMLGIGIVGQYLAKTYLETKNRPIYLVRKTNIEK